MGSSWHKGDAETHYDKNYGDERNMCAGTVYDAREIVHDFGVSG